MSRGILAGASVVVFVLLCTWAAFTQSPPPRPTDAVKVRDDLYMITGGGGNVAAYVTNEGVVLVDDMYERNAADVLAKVKSLTSQPVRYVFNTHQHDDHSGGNTVMLPIAEIVAHRNARANMAALKQPGLPRLTFSRETELFLGGKETRAAHYGRGHTGGDAFVYFPAARVIHTGDMFLSGPVIPKGPGGANIYIDYAQGGSAVEWTQALDIVLRLDFDTVIPGHGPLARKADVVKFRADFERMRNRVRDLVRGGKGKDDVSALLVGDYGWPAGGLAIQQVDAFIAEMGNEGRKGR